MIESVYQRFPIQNKRVEKSFSGESKEGKEAAPRVFRFEGDTTKPSIAVALRDPGPTNSLIPVILKLQEKQYPICLIVSGWAAEYFSKTPPVGFDEQPAAELGAFNPNVVIRTVSDVKREGKHALPEAQEQAWSDALYIDVEDYPGASKRIVEGGRKEPDVLCVMDERTKDIAEQERDLTPDQIIATGNPAFDKYAHVGGEIMRDQTRKNLEVRDDEFLVVFSGQLPPTAQPALQKTVDALNGLQTDKEIVFMYAYHPRATEEDRAELKSIVNSFTNGRVVEREGHSSDEIGYAADLLVSTHSTEGLVSMYRGVPALFVDAKKETLPPPVDAETAFWIPDEATPEETQAIFKEAIDDEEKRDENVRKGKEHFKADGKSAERVTAVVENLISE